MLKRNELEVRINSIYHYMATKYRNHQVEGYDRTRIFGSVIIHLCVHTLNGMTLRIIRNTVYMMVRIIWGKI